jgi:outer membrane protein OmpA-like peptidoglycan-associated protein
MHARVQQQAREQKTVQVQEQKTAELKEQKTVELQEKKTVEMQEKPVEVEKPVREEVLSRKPSFEPLMQINVLARSQDAVREANLQNVEIILMDDQSVKVSVQGPMFFALGKAELRPEVTQFLDRLAQIIKQTPYEVHVVGHTDDRPIGPMFPPTGAFLVRAGRWRATSSRPDLAPSRSRDGAQWLRARRKCRRARSRSIVVEIIITRTVTDPKERKQDEQAQLDRVSVHRALRQGFFIGRRAV